jgi:hypothetical protein
MSDVKEPLLNPIQKADIGHLQNWLDKGKF